MSELSPAARRRLFTACFIALVTTAFAFMLRMHAHGHVGARDFQLGQNAEWARSLVLACGPLA